MDFEVSYELEDEEQFWSELDDILSANGSSHGIIDNVLRNFLGFTVNFKDEYLNTDRNLTQCIYKLLESGLYNDNAEYIRRQLISELLQEEDAQSLHIFAAFALCDGRSNEATFELIQEESGFAILVGLVKEWGSGDQPALHRTLLELLYELSRMQRLTYDDLASVDDNFVLSLFAITESLSSDVNDPYHYPVIQVLLVLNEQYMVASSANHASSPAHQTTNRVLKAISNNISSYKTFGENLILLLNREAETSLQLLILKLLYLLFSTTHTAEYFYTNDLHVLTDVILRNLLDLPAADGNSDNDSSMRALRHTYLRVLYPLLANSQLQRPGMGYKRYEICQVLRVLSGDIQGPHFAPVDLTTIRLTKRCMGVPWLLDAPPTPTVTLDDQQDTEGGPLGRQESSRSLDGMSFGAGDAQKELARRALGMQASHGNESELSIAAVADLHEKPGIIVPGIQARNEQQEQDKGG